MNHFARGAIVMSMAALLGACSSTPPQPSAPSTSTGSAAAGTTAAPRPPTAATPRPAATSAVATVTLAAHLDPNHAVSKNRSIFFDFDDDSIRSSDRPVLETHGRYLASRSGLAIKLEGHADERGSKEYNLALGQRRAESVLKSLQMLGARTSQMEAISWGEEKPRAPGHDESAWSQNRRVDIQYPAK